jgi:molybdenum cofactor synthesis domain-containing protein
MKVLVLTISDRASTGEYDDVSGPALEQVLKDLMDDVDISRVIVPDDPNEIETALTEGLDCDVILTTGGTGLGPRDTTPEVTRSFCEREVPGLAELLRIESLKETPHAALSRATAGQRGRTLVVNLPGSVRGASFGARVLAPILPHAAKMMAGGGH